MRGLTLSCSRTQGLPRGSFLLACHVGATCIAIRPAVPAFDLAHGEVVEADFHRPAGRDRVDDAGCDADQLRYDRCGMAGHERTEGSHVLPETLAGLVRGFDPGHFCR